MNLKPARLVLCAVFAVVVCMSWTIAQDIGHLGVDSDPIPLKQVKRLRKPVFRNANRNLLAANADPASREMKADVTDQAVASTGGAKKPKSALPEPASGAISNTLAVSKTPAGMPPGGAPPTAIPLFDQHVIKAEELTAKGESKSAAEFYRQALSVKPESAEARLGLADALYDIRDYAKAEAE